MNLTNFSNYLISKNIVSQVPFYVQWVERFLHFCQSQKWQYFQTEPREQFLKNLSNSHER